MLAITFTEAALGAYRLPIFPTHRCNRGNAGLRIREVPDSFDKRLRILHIGNLIT
jgi:hypothetical protein